MADGKVISLTDALKSMRNGRAFTITGCEYNERKKTGGKRYTYTDAKLSGETKATKKANEQRLKRSLETDETKIILKNPNHRINGTRNIVLPNTNIVTIHIRLLETFNGKRIIL